MECISTFLIAHIVHCCGWLIVITMLLMVTVITVFLYWRCFCFHSRDCLIREANVQLRAGARGKLLIWEGRGGGGLLTLVHA
jgi:hypothetical protein